LPPASRLPLTLDIAGQSGAHQVRAVAMSVPHSTSTSLQGCASRHALVGAPSSSWAVRPLAASAPTVAWEEVAREECGRSGGNVPWRLKLNDAGAKKLCASSEEENPKQRKASQIPARSNPSIERRSTGKPVAPAHVKRYTFAQHSSCLGILRS
jgi:hypothetical protein